ncbi:MAG: alpha/beta hydrolase fold domain-containing protein [Opitutales bacterium]
MNNPFPLAITSCSFLLFPCSASAKEGKVGPPIKGAEHVAYKEASRSKLILNIFYPDGHDPKKEKRPAIVFFFGGGWNGGNPGQFGPHCEYLASRGMIAMSADYRVKSRQGTSPFECVKDGKSAVRWIRENAKKLGIDPDRLAAGGGSAGGHVAAATGTVKGLEEDGEDLSVSSRPNALVLFNPVYDNGPKGWGHSRVADRYKQISPIHNIRKGTPPTIVFLGDKDSLIPVSTAEKYKALMEKVGSRSDLHVYAGQPHGFFNKGRKGNYYEKTVLEMDKFLTTLGWMKDKPTP